MTHLRCELQHPRSEAKQYSINSTSKSDAVKNTGKLYVKKEVGIKEK